MPRHSLVASLGSVTLLLAACSSTGAPQPDPEPAQLRGDPKVVALANEILLPRAAALADVEYVSATCIRQENVAQTDAKFVSGGPLSLRRDPPAMLFRPSGTRNLQILEDPTTRLVVDAGRRHATRWTYERNARCIAGVAALMLDFDFLANNFTVVSAGQFEDKENLTQITFVPTVRVELAAIKRIELVFGAGKDFPLGLRVIATDDGFIDYEIQNPNLDPTWRDPAAQFRLNIPSDFKVVERKG